MAGAIVPFQRAKSEPRTYIVCRSSCWTYNQSVCHLLLEIIVCLNLEKDENGDIKGQNSAFLQ